MHEPVLLQDMAIVLAVSAAVMVLCYGLRLPVVLGYMAAGILIGPYTPPFSWVTDIASIRTLSELGVIFLLFGIGLEFSLTRLMRVGLVSFIAATFEILFMLGIGFWLGKAFGWNFTDSLFLGAILSISSTTIIAKLMLEMGKVEAQFAQVILGSLIIEDLLAVLIIALLSGITGAGESILAQTGAAVLKMASFLAIMLLLCLGLVPRLLRTLERFKSHELTVIMALGLCFGVSLAADLWGLSVAVGAFLIGAVIAETPQAPEVIRRIEPIRDMFTALFFVSVGMLFDPKVLAQFALPIACIVLVTIIGKVASCSAATYLAGYRPDTALRVGLGLAQIGEFSFIIAAMGETSGVTSPFLYPIAVSVSGVTALTTPLLMSRADPIVAWLTRVRKKGL
jgi:CPA2 family monovalent cation:H+ antiporter-2